MPTTRLIQVRSYFEPSVFQRMEQTRKSLRRTSRSRFLEDAALDYINKMERPSPSHDKPRRKKTAA